MNRRRFLAHLVLLVGLLGIPIRGGQAQQPVVYAILFFSPSCGHCHYVMEEVFPSLKEQYAEQLQAIYIDVSTTEGGTLFQATFDAVEVPADLRGYVPLLVVGDHFLIGSQEIPEQLPSLIQEGIAAGGIALPSVPGLEAIVVATPENSLANANPAEPVEASVPILQETTWLDRLRQDPVGNGLAIGVLGVLVFGLLVQLGNGRRLFGRSARPPHLGRADWLLGLGLATITTLIAGTLVFEDGSFSLPTILAAGVATGMILVVGVIGFTAPQAGLANRGLPGWLLPVIAVLGLVVASYLAYVEVNEAQAVCGAVGDCNTVQQSKHARLFGLLPIGVLGVFGYVSILAAWLISHHTTTWITNVGQGVQLSLMLFGTAFSIYLTFLEPFVIGATCAWCLTSAMLMVLLLWLQAPSGWMALARLLSRSTSSTTKQMRQE